MRSSTVILAIAVAAVTSQAWAQTPPADDAVSTAPAEGGGAPLSTRQQIDQYFATSPAPDGDRDGAAARDAAGQRRIRGEVSVGVGTGGYRSGSVSAVIPLGETGTLALSYGRTENGFGYVGHGQPGYGYGYDGLSAPLTLDANCAASRGERGWYGQPELTGRSQGSADRCAVR